MDITITLSVKELVYDVQNKSYLTGRSRQTGNNFEEVANMQASDDLEDLNQVKRSIGNALAILKLRLSEYKPSTNAIGTDNTLLSATGDITISLTMPSNFNEAITSAIVGSAHQFVVNTAVADWFTITNKADAADYAAKAEINVQQIREAINKRKRPSRSDS